MLPHKGNCIHLGAGGQGELVIVQDWIVILASLPTDDPPQVQLRVDNLLDLIFDDVEYASSEMYFDVVAVNADIVMIA
jgi:hypothetical protein